MTLTHLSNKIQNSAGTVDPSIGGSYMTLLNTAANLGSTWPASIVMYLVGQLSVSPTCTASDGVETCTGGREAYFPLQLIFSVLGILWVYFMGQKVNQLAILPDDAWRTHLDEDQDIENNKKRGKKVGKKAK